MLSQRNGFSNCLHLDPKEKIDSQLHQDDGILLILHFALQQLNLHAWSFASWYRVHRGHILTIEVLPVSESGGQTKTNICANRFALIIAFTFFMSCGKKSKFVSVKKTS